jgi:hypothetical protein
MKKFFKYLVIIIVVGFGATLSMGIWSEKHDKAMLIQLRTDSLQYHQEKGSFANFCSSDLYSYLESEFISEISCDNGQLEDGSDIQIVALLPTNVYACKKSVFPPINGEEQIAISCIGLPGMMGDQFR